MTIRVVIGTAHHERENATVDGDLPDGDPCDHRSRSRQRRRCPSRPPRSIRTNTAWRRRRLARPTCCWSSHTAHDEVADIVVDRIAERVYERDGADRSASDDSTSSSGSWGRLVLCAGARRANANDVGAQPGSPDRPRPRPAMEVPNWRWTGEPFLVPEPMETVFISWFRGEVFRSAGSHPGAAPAMSSTSAQATDYPITTSRRSRPC